MTTTPSPSRPPLAAARTSRGSSLLGRYRWELLLAVMLVGSVFVATQLSPYYLNLHQIELAMRYIMVAGMLAVGLMVVVIIGEIDLSQASIVAFGAVMFATCSGAGLPIFVALPVVVVLCTLLGVVNGVIVVRLGVPSLAVTVGTLAAYRGLAFIIGGERGYTDFDASYLWLGSTVDPFPPSIIAFAIVAAVAALLMARTTFGAYCYTIGNNTLAARFAGVPVDRVKVAAFALSGALSAMGAWILIGQYGSARGDNAEGITLFVVTTVVLGGIDIYGGKGTVLGVVLSLLVLGTLSNGMGLANVPGPTQTVVFGLLLIGSVLAPRIAGIVRSARRASRGRLAPGRTDA
jgi:rhamnose transport system permease protein